MSADGQREPVVVVLVNFHSLGDIASLLASGSLSGDEVIIVDNGDDPAGVTRLCAEYGGTPVLMAENVGFAAGVNRAVATVRTPQRPWLLLNPDVRLEPQTVSQLQRALSAGVDGVGPLLAGADGRLQIGPAGGPLTLRSVAGYFLFVAHLFPRLQGMFLTRSQSRRTREVAWLCMACLLLRPDAFTKYGPLPEDELVYAEDLAWGTAASLVGARFQLANEVTVTHRQGASGGSARWIGSVERLCRRRLGPVRGPLAVLAIRVGLGIRRLLGRSVI